MSERAINRYTDEEQQFILDHYWDGKMRDDVCRLLADRHTRASVHYQYYALLKKQVKMSPADYKALMQERFGDRVEEMRERLRRAERLSDVTRPTLSVVQPATKPQPAPKLEVVQAQTEAAGDLEGRLFSMLQSAIEQFETALQEASSSIEQRVTAKVDQQNRVWAAIAALMARGDVPDIDALVEENKHLKAENEALKAQMDEQKAEYQKIYNALNFWLGEFMSLDQVGKVTSLEDFIPRMKVIVDRFGMVQGAKKTRPLDFETLEREAEELRREAAVR